MTMMCDVAAVRLCRCCVMAVQSIRDPLVPVDGGAVHQCLWCDGGAPPVLVLCDGGAVHQCCVTVTLCRPGTPILELLWIG